MKSFPPRNRWPQAKSPPPSPRGPADGLLLVDKPSGYTSHDVVAVIRRHFGFEKVGHGGTLDPMATGLLVLLIGKGTRLSQQVMEGDKGYAGVMRLGIATATQDADGPVLEERDATAITRAQVEAEMKKWTGDVMQIPPMVSAIKKDGVPLYKLARKGQVVERAPKLLHIYEFRLTQWEPPSAHFTLRSSKGTYVRTLCADIGAALGCGAHLAQLRRTRSGVFDVAQAAPLDELMKLDKDALVARILPMNQTPVTEPA